MDPDAASPTDRFGALAGGAFVAACLALGASWGACAFGFVIASDAGMPGNAHRFAWFLLMLTGLAAGLLVRLAGAPLRRFVPFLGAAAGGALGMYAAGLRSFELVSAVALFVVTSAITAFSPIGRWGRAW
jgi:hypothetical protein